MLRLVPGCHFRADSRDDQTSMPATLDSQIALGLLYTGPFTERAGDEIGLAVGETHVNSRIAELERLQNAQGAGPVAVQSAEWKLAINL